MSGHESGVRQWECPSCVLPLTHPHSFCSSLWNSTSIFHSFFPRQQNGSMFFLLPSVAPCQVPLARASLHFGLNTFTDWKRSHSPCRGLKENREDRSCGVHYTKFIFPPLLARVWVTVSLELLYLCSLHHEHGPEKYPKWNWNSSEQRF